MIRDDFVHGLFLLVLLVIGVSATALVVNELHSAATGRNQSVDDLTDAYRLPRELAGCKVYRLCPAGFGDRLYVVTRGDEPVAVEWQEGKHRKRVALDAH